MEKNQKFDEKDKKIRREARIKTAVTFLASLFTSIGFPILVALIFPTIKLSLGEIIGSFFTRGTLTTIVFSHVITFVVTIYDEEVMYYSPKHWMYLKYVKSKNKDLKSYIFLFIGVLILLLFSTLLYTSFLSSTCVQDLIVPIVFSIFLFIADIFFNYKFILMNETSKENKNNAFDLAEELAKSQEDIKNSKDKTEFPGGKI